MLKHKEVAEGAQDAPHKPVSSSPHRRNPVNEAVATAQPVKTGMADSPQARTPYNNVVRSGMWMTVAAALVWVGGVAYEQIKTYVPWALALGIAVMIIGLIMQFRMVRKEH